MNKKFVNIARVVPEMSSRMDRHTHTDVLITILCNCSCGWNN